MSRRIQHTLVRSTLLALALMVLLSLQGPFLLAAGPVVGFGVSNLNLNGNTIASPTTLEFGPDGKLYMGQQNGDIKVFTVSRTAANSYIVTAATTINSIRNLPNRNDNGTTNATVQRQLTGLIVRGTATNPIIYATSSDYRKGTAADTNLDTNSGVITRLTWNGSAWTVLNLVQGLPRSEEYHAINGLQLDAANNRLYVAIGGNTNMGAPGSSLAYLPEYAYSSAILSVDLTAIGNTTYNMPTLDDPTRANVNGITDPLAPGYTGIDVSDPWGGNDGLNQAKMVAGSPVQIYASGFRNPYDLVLTQSGRLYASDNGPNSGFGGFLVGEQDLIGSAGQCTNQPNENNSASRYDNLHLVTQGLYAGHPNPIRANLNAGWITAAGTYMAPGSAGLPVDWPPVPANMIDPRQCDFRSSGYTASPVEDGSLAGWTFSTNGITEYTASNFANQMKGNLLLASYSNTVQRVELNAGGTSVTAVSALASNFGSNTLDVTSQSDFAVFPGTVWAVNYASNTVTVLEPNDYAGVAGACDSSDSPTLDPDNDGFKNSDEIDNGTSPCSGASRPHDYDNDKISDLNDNDDDNDSILDINDPFQVDPNNGLTTNLPMYLSFDPGASDFGVGIVDSGFTGMMINNSADYLTLYDYADMTVGGITKTFTVDSVPSGDAFAGLNNQTYSFQKGINVDSSTPPFTVRTRVNGPFFNGTTPSDNQSLGLLIGTGDQDNYIKLVVNANGGAGGIQLVRENNGSTVITQFNTPVLSSSYINLYLTVTPFTGQIQARYSNETGVVTDLGAPFTANGPVKSAIQQSTKALAVGIISTSRGGTPFTAQWDDLEVNFNQPNVLSVTPGTYGFPTVATGQDAYTSLILKNEGVGSDPSITVTALNLTGSAAFTISSQPPMLPITLAPGQTEIIGVRFAPTIDGSASTLFRVTHSGANGQSTAGLSGVGQSQAAAIYRVNAGGPQVTDPSGGIPWGRDQTGTNKSTYFKTGSDNVASGAINTNATGAPNALFTDERWDAAAAPEMTWAFPVAAGQYEVRLYFAENCTCITAAGQRTFHVDIEGTRVLTNFDQFATALAESGNGRNAIVRKFPVTITGTGQSIDLLFTHAVENTTVKAIEIVPTNVTGALVASPGALSFGTVTVGSSSATQTIRLSNSSAAGGPSVAISALSTTGTGMQIVTPPTLPRTLTPGQFVDVSVRFVPTASGAVNGTLNVTHNGTNTPLQLQLTGQGNQPPAQPATLSPESNPLQFNTVQPGMFDYETLQLNNLIVANAPSITISNVSITGPGAAGFSHNFSGPVTVTSGQAYALTLMHNPMTEGAKTATLTVTHSGSNSPLQIALEGDSTPGALPAINVNFQNPNFVPPTGYVRDFGEAFGARTLSDQGSGLYYGWVVPGTHTPRDLSLGGTWPGNGRRRFLDSDPRLDTIFYMQYTGGSGTPLPGSWEIAIPNGTYLVTVVAGDPQVNTGTNAINAEGISMIAPFTQTAEDKSRMASKSVTVADGRLTIDANGGTNTRIQYLTIQPMTEGQPYVTGTNPPANSTGVATNTGVAAYVSLPHAGMGVNGATLNSTTIKFFETNTNTPVPATYGTSGGLDVITVQPTASLSPNTSYTLQITAGVQDMTGSAFVPYTMSFTTGTSSGGSPLTGVTFEQAESGAPTGNLYTSLTIGPDGRLYAASLTGTIYSWAINADGTLADLRLINNYSGRAIIGLVFSPSSTASNMELWITHNYPALNAAPNFSGAISALTSTNGITWTGTDYITGTPRAVRDHMTNSLSFGPGGYLFLTQGSVSAMGDRDNAWGLEPETILSGAVLRIDVNLLKSYRATYGVLDVSTGTPNAEGDLLDANNTQLGDPRLSTTNTDLADPNKYYNPQAANAPLIIYADGMRNAFDLVWHSSGHLYVPTNGSAGGGNSPATPSILPVACQNRLDKATNGNYTGPQVPAATGISTQSDYLFRVVQNGFYGHPNPTRCEWVLNGGNPTAGVDPAQVGNHYPVGTLPDRNYRGFAYDMGMNASSNGVIEYKNDAFGGILQGRLMVVRYSLYNDIVVLQIDPASGNVINASVGTTGLTGFVDPLDLTENVTNGNLYVSDLAADGGKIVLVRPLGANIPRIEMTPAELFFSDQIGGNASATQEITIRNTGTGVLELTNIAVTGPFQLSGTPPVSVPPFSSVTINVAYQATAAGVQTGAVTVTSNATNAATVSTLLSGAGFSTANTEPSLQLIVNTYHIPVNIGDDNAGTAVIHSDTAQQKAPLLGQEISVQSFQRYEDGNVDIQVLAVFGPQNSGDVPVATVGWYMTGQPNTRTNLFTIGNSRPQSLNPIVNGITSFDPGTNMFGFWSNWPFFGTRNIFSEDGLNTFTNAIPHHIRVYQLLDSDGVVVPNAYVVATEEHIAGFDYNDLVMIVRNVKPAQTDITPPEVSVVISGSQQSPNVYINQATISVTSSDIGTGVTSVEYNLDNTGFVPYTGPFVVNTATSHSIIARATDGADLTTVTPTTNFSIVTIPSSGKVRYENMDWVTLNARNIPEAQYLNTWLVMSNLKSTVIERQSHHTVTLRIHNEGTTPLQILGLDLSDPARWSLPQNPTLPRTVAAGSFYDLRVRFIENGDGVAVYQGTLKVTTTDPTTPVQTVELRGIYQDSTGGSNENTFYDLTHAFGITTSIPPVLTSTYVPMGAEVQSFYWKQVPGIPSIYARALVAYHGCLDSDQLVFVNKTSAAPNQGGTEIIRFEAERHNCQSALPDMTEGGNVPTEITFSTAVTKMTIWSASNAYETDQCGTVNPITNCKINGIRIWPVYNPAGQLVPNLYFIGQDFVGSGCGVGSANCDFQDNMWFVYGIMPETTSPGFSITKTGTSTEGLINTNFTYTIKVKNTTVFPAAATVTDTLPAGMTYVSSSTNVGTCSFAGSTLTCPLGTMNGAAEATITIVVKYPTVGYVDNTATLTSGSYTVSEGERTLFYDASNPPGKITITKNAIPNTNITFDFNGGLGNFSLVDDGIHNGTALTYNVNFGTSTTPPAGFDLGDIGLPYTSTKGYGWVTEASRNQNNPTGIDISGTGRDRAQVGITPEENTYLNMQYPTGTPGPAAWRYDLPNGTYNVTVSVGDATSGNASTSYTVRANGTTIISNYVPEGNVNEPARWKAATGTITVSNGRLILDAVGGTNTKINYVKIQATSTIAPTRVFPSLVAGTYTVNELVPLGWTQDSIICSGGTTSNSGTGTTITLGAAQNISCTFVNSKISGPAITIDVTPATQSVVRNGTATFTVTVTNVGSQSLTNVTTTSAIADCAKTRAGTMLPNDDWTYTCSATPITESITNNISVTGTGSTGNPTANDSALVTMVTPDISIDKTPDSQTMLQGYPVTFTITVKNTGDVDLTGVAVTDTAVTGCAKTIGNLAAGATYPPYTCTLATTTTTLTNVAAVTGTYGATTVTATDSAVASVNTVTYGTPLFRVNAGGPQVAGTGGPNWTVDTAASKSIYLVPGGQNNVNTQTNAFTNNTGAPNAVFNDERSDPAALPIMAWKFPVSAGQYEVRLYFLEQSRTTIGGRVFDVNIEGALVLDDFDIWKEAGSARVAIMRKFPVTITGTGQNIDIDFLNGVENPSVRAIEIVPMTITQAATLSATPTNVDFGDGQITRTSAPVTINLKNLGGTGAASINVTNVTITGAGASQFAVTPTGTTNMTLTAGQTLANALSVTFKPTTLGAKSATLQITHNGTNSPTLVYLSGMGVPLVLPDLVGTPNPFIINQVETVSTQTTNIPLSTTEGSANYTINNATFPSWLSITPLTGTIPANGTVQLAAQTNITGLALGTYTYDVPITAPGYDPMLLTVTLNVNPYVHPIHTTAQTGGVITWVGGTIDGGGNANVRHNTNATFNFTSQIGYAINDVLIDGVSIGVVGSYTFNSVVADGHTVEVRTSPVTVFVIIASAQTGGTVSPTGVTNVNHNSEPQFNFFPDTGYMVDQVLVDGSPVTFSGTYYKFPSIQTNHQLEVSFKLLVPSGIKITADNVPNAAGNFNFTITDSGPFSDSFTLADTGSSTNVRTYNNMQPATYTVTGTVPTDRVLNSLTCTGASYTTDLATGKAVISVTPGSNVECIYQATLPPSCTPYSAALCSTVPVTFTPNFCLSFDAPAGGLSETGFTMVEKPTVNKYPITPSVPLVPGYEPSLIALSGGQLVITSTRGLSYQTQATNNTNNTQVNALGVGIHPTTPFIIKAQVINQPFGDTSYNEQSGIWFGLNDDNYVKLVVANRPGTGNGLIELRREISGATVASDPLDVRQANVTNVNTATITLELRLNPTTNEVSAKYTSSTGETGVVGPLNVPASFFTGQMLPDGTTGPESFAGVLSSSRSNTTTPALPFRFDNFCIQPNTNQAPVATADSISVGKGAIATSLDSGATSVLANDTDAEGDAMTAILVTPPTAGALTLNANGTFSYTHNNSNTLADSFMYKVSDGQGQSNVVLVTINVILTCAPYANAACTTIPVTYTPNFCLSFNAPAGGLSGTGFTMVDKPSVNKYPATPSQPSYPGYEPGNIALTGGQLVITSTRGMAYQTPTQNAANNTQVNALGVGVAPTGPFMITLDVINAPFPDAANNEQSGIWFGLNDDNFVKLVLANRTGAGNGLIELRREVGGVSAGTGVDDVRQANVTNVNTATITLELRLNPTSDEISGEYTSSTGETGVLGPLSVPHSFFAGTMLPDGTTGPVSFAGLYASSRFNTTTPALPFTFDNFCIKPNTNQVPVATGDAITVAKGTTATVLDSGATSVLANDTDAEGDPLTAILVSNVAHGTLVFNANGTFSYTHDNGADTTDSFTYKVSDGQGQSNTVTVNISIVVVCSPYANAACNTIPVSYTPNFCLSFAAPAGGLAGTGFTMVDKPSVNKYPVTPSVSALPGYEPSLISVTGGQLKITATRGSFNQTQTENTGNNTQVNALGVGISPTAPIIIKTDVINSPLPDTSNGEQSGIWFGLNEDNYIRLAVTNRTGAGLGQIELRREVAGFTSGSGTYTRLADIANVNTSTISLELRLNPLTKEVTAKYTSTNGETGILGPLVVPDEFIAGQMVPNASGTTGPVSFAGLYTTNRFNAGTALQFTFDNFCVQPNPNQVPTAVNDSMTVPRGTTQTVLDSSATSVLANDTDAEGDAMTAILVTGPAHGTLTLNANGTFSYTHDNGADNTDSFTYKVSDGQGQSNTVTVSITIYTACTPYSTSTCNTVPVNYNPNFCLSFNAPAGGLAGTGFTMVDKPSVNKYPATPSVPALPGYEPSLINVTGGQLVITSTRGSLNQTQTENTGNNTQVNALGVGISPTGLTTITVQIINPTFPDTSNGEQVGIWFGLGEDDHVKFAVTNTTGANKGLIELRREIGGVTSGSGTNTRLSPEITTTPATFLLEMRLDPINNQVSGKYTSSTGETGILGPLAVPPAFFAGKVLTDGTTTTSFAGIYTTSRFNAGTPLVFTYDNFCIQPNPDQAPVGTADSMTVAKGTAQTVLDSGATSVLANDTDAEGDPLTAVLVTGPANGTLTLNANGTFTYTHNNSATTTDSFTYKANDGQRDSAPVTVSINIYVACTPISSSPCNTVPVTTVPPYCLTFNAPAGGLAGTGFKMVMSRTNNSQPTYTTPPALTGYEPNNIALTGGRLVISGTRGTFHTTNNNQLNALAVGVAPQSIPFLLMADVVNSPFPTTSLSEQSGLWFGVDEDHMVRLAVNNNGSGNGIVELRLEDGINSTTRTATVTNVTTATVTLKMILNPTTNQVTAEYASSTGATGSLTAITVPASFFQGIMLPDTTTGPVSYAGLFASSRNNGVTPLLQYTFDNFCVRPVSAPPVAAGESLTVAEGGTATTLTGGATSVLANDTDPESDPLTAAVVTNPTNGTLTLNANGTFSYVHNGSETTSDSFTYRANDGVSNSNTVTVTITVTPVNDAPVAVDDAYSTNEDTLLTVTAANKVTLNDTDAENGTLTVSLVANVAHGTLALAADGTFTYTPAANYTGTDTFTYRASDGTANSAPATVTITINPVNDAPVAVANTLTVAEGGTATTLTGGATSVLANDTDEENNPLTAILVTGPANGSLTLNADGTFSYTHNGSETTTDSFTYKANDGTSDSNTVTVSITITPVNDAPVAVDDGYSVNEGGTLTVTAANKITLNDTDAENNPLTVTLVSNVTNGTLTLNANGTFTYTHNGSETITDSFTYRASDGTATSNVATVTITINPVSDAPVAVADALTVAEGGTATTLTGGATSVLANDTDVENDTLTAVLVTGPANGSLTLNADGTFSYVHNGSETTTDSFTYRANDGTSNSNTVTVSITITPVNDAPVAADNGYSVNEGGTLTVTAANKITLNDTDAENNPLTVTLVSDVTNGTLTLNADGTFTYTHNGSETTSDSFTYRANDGTVDSNVATVTITIIGVNDAPVAVADAITVNEGGTATTLNGGATSVLANDTDPENNTLTAAVVTSPANGTLTLNPNGTFSYVHNGSETTSDSFTYRANDGTVNSNTVTVTITINPVNDAPVANDDTYNVDEDTTLTVTAANKITLNDTDAENNTLTVSLVVNVAHGTLTLNSDGTFTYTPAANYSGTDTFTYTASDGFATSNTATVTINVGNVNDAPVAVADAITVAEGGTATTLAGGATSVLTNDTDEENDTLTATLVTNPVNGSLLFNANGTFSYVHNGSETTTDSFTYKASDGNSSSNTVTVSITITPVNDAPVANPDTYVMDEDTTLIVTAANKVTLNDTDAENNPLTAVLVAGPAHGSLTLNSNGTFTYTPVADYYGTDSFTYKANDGQLDSNTTTVTITINNMNEAPVAVADALTVAEGGTAATLTGGATSVLTNDTDADGNTLTAILVTGPANGTLTLNSNGTFSYVHGGSETTVDSFTYKANDGTVDSNTVTVSITINPVNDAPVAVNDAYSTNEDTMLTVTAANKVTLNDTDVDSATLTAVLVTGPAHGTLTLNSDGTFTYTPALNYNGTDSFTYMANDGAANSGSATVTITINPVADAPIGGADSYSVVRGGTLTIAAAGVLTNDSDPDAGDTISVASIFQLPVNGSLTYGANGSFTYIHNGGATTSDTFVYVLADSDPTTPNVNVTVTLTIGPNQPPVAVADAITVANGAAATVLTSGQTSVLANDTDAEGNALTAVLVTGPTKGSLTLNANGTFTYTHNGSPTAPDSFTYTATDGMGVSNTATVTITVTGTAATPVAVGDNASVNKGASVLIPVTLNDTFKGTPVVTIVSAPTVGTAVISGTSIQYTAPTTTSAVQATFTYKITDISTLASNTVTVTVIFTVNGPSLYLDATQLTMNPTVGSNVQFSILVRNNGNVAITNIMWASSGGPTACTYPNFDLAVGQEVTMTCQDNNVQRDYDRTFIVENVAGTAGGAEVIRVSVSSAPAAPLSSAQVTTTPSATTLNAGLYQSTDSRITYAGNWASFTDASYTYRRSTTPQDRAGFSFTGDGLVIYRAVGPGFGSMDICLNYVCQTISNENATVMQNQPVQINFARNTYLGEVRVNKSSDVRLNIIQVLDSQAPAAPVATTPAPTTTPVPTVVPTTETPVVTPSPTDVPTETPAPTTQG